MPAIDLAAQARRAGKKPGTIVEMRAIETTRSQEQDLTRLYMRVVNLWSTALRESIVPTYRTSLEQAKEQDRLNQTTDSANDINVEIEQTNSTIVRAIISFRSAFTAWAEQLQLWHMRRFISQLTYSTNVDLSTQMGPADVQETMQDVINRNVALIQNVSDQERGRIADIVFRGLQNRTPIVEVERQLREAVGLSRARARRIASDQTVKLAAALDKQRQLQVGMESFEWLHSRKENYRPWHKARDGKIFSWESEVAKTDPPGFAPFCGCKARGVLEI